MGNAKLGIEGGGFEELGFFLGPGLWVIGVWLGKYLQMGSVA